MPLSLSLTLVGLLTSALALYFWPSYSQSLGITPQETFHDIALKSLKVIVWGFGYAVSNQIINYVLWEKIAPRRTGRPIPALLKTISSILLLFICATLVLTLVFKRSLTGVLAVGGGMSLILGIALQDMIADFFSGLAINIDRPFRIGDFILLNNTRLGDDELIGKVVSINWRTTRLEKTDGTLVVIPNNKFSELVLTNFSLPKAESRFELSYCIDFASDTERVSNVLNAAVLSAPTVLPTPPPKVRVNRVDDKGVHYTIRYWIDPRLGSPLRARHGVNSAVLRHLRFAGISIAYERNDIYFAEMPPRQVDFTKNLEALVARVALFKSIPAEGIARLSSALKPRSLSRGEIVVKAGDAGDSMFIIVEGLLEVYLDIEVTIDDLRVATMSPGDYFGEMSLITGTPRSATVLTKTEALVYEVGKSSLEPLFEAYPSLPASIAQTVAQRDFLRENAVAEVEERVALESAQNEARDQLLQRMKRFFQL